jgi:hypothetical protein
LLSVWVTNRKQVRQSASLRLNSGGEEEVGKPSKWATGFLVFGLLLVAGGIAMSYSAAAQGAFFVVGFGVLVVGLAVFRKRLSRIGFLGEFSSEGVAKVNLARRASRSLTVVGVLAAGVFLVLSVASFRKNGGENWEDKASGAGGFAWWVETTSSVNRPADARGEVDWFGLKNLVPFRIGEGDDVDCFNLTASSHPRLLGVDPDLLEGRFKTSDQWSILEGDGVPAIVDETTMMWVLKKKIGDELIYQDEWGNDFSVTIAGVVKDSIFQGSLILSEKNLLEKYPALFRQERGRVGSRQARDTSPKDSSHSKSNFPEKSNPSPLPQSSQRNHSPTRPDKSVHPRSSSSKPTSLSFRQQLPELHHLLKLTTDRLS